MRCGWESIGRESWTHFLYFLFNFLLPVALLTSPPGAAIKIGTCSLGTFIYGGQSCQRTMMNRLKNNPQLSCRYYHCLVVLCATFSFHCSSRFRRSAGERIVTQAEMGAPSLSPYAPDQQRTSRLGEC